MSIAPGLSLDQLKVLVTVDEAGSFSAAGRRLNRATSAVSYAIDTLEQQLGLLLFDRGTTRRPRLTPAGEAVVAEARSIIHGADVLRARVKGLHDGLEAELSLAVDQIFPRERLSPLLKELHSNCSTVPLRLETEVRGGVERLIRSGQSSVGVGNLFHSNNDGLTVIQIAGVPIVPVAASDHPLATSSHIEAGVVRKQLQIVLRDVEESNKRPCFMMSHSVWRVGDLATMQALLLEGVGWAGMPEPVVRADIEAGRLKRLKMPDFRGSEYPLYVAYKTDNPPGPAGRWLIERLVNEEADDLSAVAGWQADAA